jgi:phosphate transport system substrate-binding protein
MFGRMWVRHLSFAAFIFFVPQRAMCAPDVVRVRGSATLASALSGAVPILREQYGVEMRLLPEGGSSQAILSVGAGTADVAMSTRALTAEDRANFPSARFAEERIGMQALAVIVPRDVWAAGVRALKQEQLIGIHEGDIKNWQQVGGEDRAIKVYSPERGHGTWEFYVTWLYGDIRRAPLGKAVETVATPKGARDIVEFNAGSMSIAPPQYADGKNVFALGIVSPKGEVIEPSVENVLSGKYPLARPLVLITGDRPTGGTKKLFDLMRSPKGVELLSKTGFIPATEPSVPGE